MNPNALMSEAPDRFDNCGPQPSEPLPDDPQTCAEVAPLATPAPTPFPTPTPAPAPTPAAPPPAPATNPLQSAVNAGVFNSPEYFRQTAVVTKATTLSGVVVNGQRPRVRFMGAAEGKGGLLVKGAKLTIENVELWEAASVSSGNGAAIRFEAAGGVPCDILARNVAFRYNENGLLGPDLVTGGGVIELVDCEFDRNGRMGSGQEHGIYIGKAAHLIVNRCHFHDTYTGHELKSRAVKSTLINSTFGSPESRASYEAEFPNGGDVSIARCTFIQSPRTDNTFVLGYGAEWTQANAAPVNKLIVRDCVFWNFHKDGYALRVDPKVPSAQIEFHNCTFINFTQTWSAEYRIETVLARGMGNRALTLEQGYAEFPNGPRLKTPANIAVLPPPPAGEGWGGGTSFANALPVREWVEVAGTRMADQLDISAIAGLEHLSAKSQLPNLINAWGGAVRVGNDIICHGTGHGTGAINARAAFSLDTFQWRWVSPQSAQAIMAQVNPYNVAWPKDPAPTWHTRPVTPAEDKKNTVPVNGVQRVLAGQLPDSQPAAFHGWNNAFVLPDGRFGSFYRTADIAVYEPGTQRWTFHPFPNLRNDSHAMMVQVDEKNSHVYALINGKELLQFNGGGAFELVATHKRPIGCTHAVRVGREVWYFGGTHGDQLVIFDLDTRAIAHTQLTFPANHAGQHFQDCAAVAYDPMVGIVRMDRLGQMFTVDPNTMMCEPFKVNGPNLSPVNGLWTRFGFHKGMLWALPDGARGLFLLKL